MGGWGEPLLNKDLYRMIQYAHKQNLLTILLTNFSKVGERGAKKMVSSGLDLVIISFDGATKETYEKYRVGGNFDQVISNIRTLVNVKKRHKKRNPVIELQFLIMQHNEHEVRSIQSLAKDLEVDSLSMAKVRVDCGLGTSEKIEILFDRYNEWLPSNGKLSRYDYKTKRRKKGRKVCLRLWFKPAINWNGSISPCCSVYEESEDFGNMLDRNFKEVWNNIKFRASRALFVGKERSISQTICWHCKKEEVLD